MAVAAYASLVSLTHLLDNLHCRAPFQCPLLDIRLVETLQESVHFLLDFVEAHSLSKREGIEALWRKITEFGFEAEDTIDFHVVNVLRGGSQADAYGVGFSTFCQDMQKLIEKIESIKKEITAEKDEGEDVPARVPPSIPLPVDGPSATASGSKSAVMVGFDKYVEEILDVLTSVESHLQILPIVGAGGIGKTTLAKNIFDHPLIKSHFDICMWVTMSQQYSIERILRDLLQENGESIAQLGEKLHKKLFGRRYLIVVDDVWTSEAWDDLKMFFQDNDEGSWIMMTTRLLNVGNYVGSQYPCLLDFLNNDDSWNLFCQKVFAQDDCPHSKLEKIGRDIAKSCRGLPLLINVIGGLLVKSDMAKEYWEFVAQNVSTLGNLENEEYCLRSLSLSYENLPIQLKPCFLHMRVYVEDANIFVSELIHAWIAEGFIKLVSDKSLEEIAKQHIKDLIDRNLIFVRKRTHGGEIETCGIHDLLRDLCIRESTKECFIYSPKLQHRRKGYDLHLCVYCCEEWGDKEPTNAPEFVHVSPSTLEICPFRCDVCKNVYSLNTRLKLIVQKIFFGQQSELRYAFIPDSLPFNIAFISVLYLLWNLQTLRLPTGWDCPIVLPSQIWDMPQLRHLEFDGVFLLKPKVTLVEGKDSIVLKNLQTLCFVKNFICTKELCDRIPNVKKLGISEPNSTCDLTQLRKLEWLTILAGTTDLAFPDSLKKLELSHCLIPWEDMTVIGSMPNLEELDLEFSGKGRKWNPIKGEFRRLKGLRMFSCDVEHWGADADCFPRLEWLILEYLEDFEIPLDIGCMDTLRSIELYSCGKCVIESAKKIWEEHGDMDNENLQICCWGPGFEHQVDASRLEELETVDQILEGSPHPTILEAMYFKIRL